MFERLQRPYLTVETGEAYQPNRLTYEVYQAEKLIETLDQLKCCERNPAGKTWNWYWTEECNELHFESIDSFKKNTNRPVRLATLTLRDDKFYINLPSFKRACLAVPFFHRHIDPAITKIDYCDFINKVFGTDERLPHGFAELFKEDELDKIIQKRLEDYEKTQERVEQASTPEEAFNILATYTEQETKKRLPYAERFVFHHEEVKNNDPEMMFLGFYIFLRGRELVAIRRWYGETGISLADIAEETVEQIFGGNMDIDIIE